MVRGLKFEEKSFVKENIKGGRMCKLKYEKGARLIDHLGQIFQGEIKPVCVDSFSFVKTYSCINNNVLFVC